MKTDENNTLCKENIDTFFFLMGVGELINKQRPFTSQIKNKGK